MSIITFYLLAISIYLLVIAFKIKRGKIIIEKTAWGKTKQLFKFIERKFIGILALIGFLFSFMIYQNDINPGKLKMYELTNGIKTVRFQEMSHIANQDFYDSVKKQIDEANKLGYVLYYEEVTDESEGEKSFKEVSKNIGVEPTVETYEMVSSLLGNAVTQSNDDLINGVKAENVDLTATQILQKYKEKTGQIMSGSTMTGETASGEIKSSQEKPVLDANRITEIMSEGKMKEASENFLMKYIFKGMMNFVLKNDWFRDFGTYITGANSDFYEFGILGARNEHLAYTVSTSKDKKIFVIYGAQHFKGFIEELRKIDNNWSVKEVNSFQPF